MGDKHEFLFNLSDVKTFPDTEEVDDKTTFTIPKAVYDKLLTVNTIMDIVTALILNDKEYDAIGLLKVLIGKEGA